MASSNPTRRVLSDLNINILPPKIGATSLTKSNKVGELSLQTNFRGDVSGAVSQSLHLGSSKRDADIHGPEPPTKRHKTVSSPRLARGVGAQDVPHGQSLEGGIDDDRALQFSPSRVCCLQLL
jgi:hypothetical protein